MTNKRKPTHRKHHRLHDYKSRCIYHITLVVSDRVPLFGKIVGDTVDEARVEHTELGFAISEEIQALPARCAKKERQVEILAKVVMPEHIHFVLMVEKPMDVKLQMVIRGFKQGCNKRLRFWLEKAREIAEVGNLNLPNGSSQTATANEQPNDSTQVPTTAGTQRELPSGIAAFLRQLLSCGSDRIQLEHALFEEDFDETRLRKQGQLKSMIAYVHNNPRHRWLKQHKPEWLCVTRGIVIAGRSYDAIGNVNLLGLPRHQVHCRYKWEHDHDTEARRNHQNECVIKARQNYALVSPFVSPHEAAVRDFCLEEGHSVIVLHNNGFTDFSQCPGGLYDYCVQGQVLVLVPSDWPHDDRKGVCSRQECVALNDYAEEIANEK